MGSSGMHDGRKLLFNSRLITTLIAVDKNRYEKAIGIFQR
jgi:hypothetical protein